MIVEATPFMLATRFIGIAELGGPKDHPLIQWGFVLCGWDTETHDEVPWCSAWAQIPAFLAGAERSKSAAARSWLNVGEPIELADARPGWDIVIFARGTGTQGHVGYYAGRDPAGNILTLGGNQSDRVCIAPQPVDRLLDVRRLSREP